MTGEVLGLAPNFDNNLALNAGTSSSPSTYLLKLYLKEIGLLAHQKGYIERLNRNLFDTIDRKVKEEMRADLGTRYIMHYLKKVLEVLN